MAKNTIIGRWGNSLAVRIPEFIVDNLELKPGDQAELSYHGNRIMIEIKVKPLQLKTSAEVFDEELRRQLHERGVPGY